MADDSQNLTATRQKAINNPIPVVSMASTLTPHTVYPWTFFFKCIQSNSAYMKNIAYSDYQN